MDFGYKKGLLEKKTVELYLKELDLIPEKIEEILNKAKVFYKLLNNDDINAIRSIEI